MKRGTSIALLALLCSPAEAQDLLGRHGHYDATYHPEIRRRSLDQAYLRGDKPSYAEERGLAGAPTVEIRRNYVYVQDTDGTLTIPFQRIDNLYESFNFALREVYGVLPDEFVFVYLFTSFDTRVGAFFYAPEANTTRGIQQQIFDQNGPSPREGFVFMNYWRSFEEIFGQGGAAMVQGQARSVFNQEAGHRWASFVTAGASGGGQGTDVMLGRDESHWSYFMHTGGSPMEGNGWRDNGNGTFTTTTDFRNWHFSHLDQYLMGMRAPEDVAPWFVITGPNVTGARDLEGNPPQKASTPQILDPQTIRGTRVDLTIDDVIARNGTRQPPMGQAPTRFRVVFVMLAGRTSGLNESDRLRFEMMVDDYATGFKAGVENRGELDYLLTATPKTPIGGNCADTAECDMAEATVCLVVPPVPAGSGLCTRPCSSPGSCPGGWCCQAAQSGVSVCLPANLCAPEVEMGGSPDAGVPACTCDTTTACDANCACDQECNAPCGCDKTTACDSNCACDPECNTPCTCDTTTACDPSCGCDPECKGGAGLLDDRRSGCDCAAERSPARYSVMLALAPAVFGLLLLIARRRR